jgi:membrane protease YdiL (CAAX protease family)
MVGAGREYPLQLDDEGEDIFDRAALIWEWSDERIKAVMEDAPELPAPPRVFADITAIKVGFGTTLLYEISLISTVLVLVRLAGVRNLRTAFGLDRFDPAEVWAPILAVAVLYVLTVSYGVAVDALDIDLLKPRSNVPEPIVRDTTGLAMAGLLACIAAPIAEEVFFRGFLFRGLLRHGKWLAAIAVSFVFAVAHLSVGAVIPFFLVGLTMCYLYWRRGCLWDTILFHLIFNSTSFILLILTRE